MNSAGSQYRNVLSGKEVGALIERGTKKATKAAATARTFQNKYTAKKYNQIRKNVEELKGIQEDRERRGITSFGDPETGTVFPLKSEAVIAKEPFRAKPDGPRRATSAGASLSSVQQRGTAASTSATGGA